MIYLPMKRTDQIRNPKSEIRKKSEARNPKQRSSFVGFFSAFCFLLSAFGALILSGCGKPHESAHTTAPALPSASVRVEVIQPRKLPVVEEVVGTVKTRQSADIEAKVSGHIVSLPVKLGQSVKEGDLLVTLATDEIEARLGQAEAAFHQAQIDFQRVAKLREGGAATQAEYDSATFRRESTLAAVAEARAMLSYAKIKSPMAGVVARKDAEVGDMAMPGRPLLRIEDPSNLRLEADVPDSVLARVKPGGTLAVCVDAIGAKLDGKVAEIAPVADPATRSVRVKLDLPTTPGLLPGQFGRLSVQMAEAEFLVVPTAALVSRGQLEIVFVARDGKAQMRIVRVGRQLDGGVEILAGLAPGESVVVDGAAGLREGQPLETK